jgi:hypothetical protein
VLTAAAPTVEDAACAARPGLGPLWIAGTGKLERHAELKV